MELEVKKINEVNKAAEAKCQVQFIPKSKLPRSKQPFGAGVLGYRINGLKLYPECKWMAIAEPAFVNQLRAIQNKLANSILNSKELFQPEIENNNNPWLNSKNASEELIKMDDDLIIDYVN